MQTDKQPLGLYVNRHRNCAIVVQSGPKWLKIILMEAGELAIKPMRVLKFKSLEFELQDESKLDHAIERFLNPIHGIKSSAVEALVNLKENKMNEEIVAEKPKRVRKPKVAEKPKRVRKPKEAAVRKPKEVAAPVKKRTGVIVSGVRYSSTAQAFLALDLPMGKAKALRLIVKASEEAVSFRHEGKTYSFKAFHE